MVEEDSDEKADESPEDIDEIDIVYTKSDDYKILPATGSRGGVQAQGNFKLDFTLDYSNQPKFETHEVTPAGLGEITHREGEPKIVRELQVGIHLSQRDALSVASWMISSLLGPDVTEDEITELVHSEYEERFMFSEQED